MYSQCWFKVNKGQLQNTHSRVGRELAPVNQSWREDLLLSHWDKCHSDKKPSH